MAAFDGMEEERFGFEVVDVAGSPPPAPPPMVDAGEPCESFSSFLYRKTVFLRVLFCALIF
jgi:hypothetical protein